MKKKILITSGSLTLMATLLAIGTTLFVDDTSVGMAVRLMSVSGFLGLGSIGLFFAGLAYPKDKN